MKIFRYLSIICLCLILLLTIIWVRFGYPDDQRITPFPAHTLSPLHQYEHLAFSLFSSPQTAQHSMGPDELLRQQQLLKEEPSAAPWIQTSSARIRQPWQVYLSAGSYPERLEGRDAILIPAGQSFRFHPGVQGRVRLETGALSLGDDLVLELRSEKRILRSWKLTKKTAPRNHRSFWYANIGRYLQPDAPVPGGQWENLSVSWQSSDKAQLSFTCRGKQGHCLISGANIWQHQTESKPNILLILVDTMRKDALDDPVSAPFMHQFSSQNIHFSRTMAAGNMTSPSTNALLACRKPTSLGTLAFSYSMNQQEKDQYYLKNPASFPQSFRDAGWETAMIGNVSVISEVMGVSIDHGFSQQIAIEQPGYDTAAISREALHWLSQHGHKPFFLYLHFHAPHAPYRPPFRDLLATFPGLSALSSHPDVLRWLYKGEIHHTDRYVQKVIEGLRSMRLEDSTTIVLTADHGDHHEVRFFGDNDVGPAFTGSYFDHGATLFHDEINVPLVISPASRRQNSEISQTVSGLDTGPTLLSLARLPVPEWCEGHSLTPLFHQESTEEEKSSVTSRTLGFEGFHRRGIFFGNRYKYIRQYSPVRKRIYPPGSLTGTMVSYFSEELLYDMEHDPAEAKNLTYQQTELLQQARLYYREYYRPDVIYELFISNPEEEELEIIAEKKQTFMFGMAGQPLKHGKIRYSPGSGKEYRWASEQQPLSFPEIRLGGKRLAVSLTSMRLPLSADTLGQLPIEHEDEQTFPRKAAAWIRKTEAHGVHKRQIRAVNPDFEKLLKEWGYLNDNS
ncbi:MAG: sulfatase [Deltaproteobacteria bacterium]|nr:sulfatase [Deltaproteobacteria bacterium]